MTASLPSIESISSLDISLIWSVILSCNGVCYDNLSIDDGWLLNLRSYDFSTHYLHNFMYWVKSFWYIDIMSLLEASTPESGERLNIDSTWNNFLMYIKTFIIQCFPDVHSLNSTLYFIRINQITSKFIAWVFGSTRGWSNGDKNLT